MDPQAGPSQRPPIPEPTYASYTEYLKALADEDDQFRGLHQKFEENRTEKFVGQANPDSRTRARFRIVDIAQGLCSDQLSIRFDASGESFDMKSAEIEGKVATIQKPTFPCIRLMTYCYQTSHTTPDYLPSTIGKLLNYSLLDAIGHHYGAHPQLFLPHCSPETSHHISVPLRRNVLRLCCGLGDSFLLTMQICEDEQYPEMKTVIILVRDPMYRNRSFLSIDSFSTKLPSRPRLRDATVNDTVHERYPGFDQFFRRVAKSASVTTISTAGGLWEELLIPIFQQSAKLLLNDLQRYKSVILERITEASNGSDELNNRFATVLEEVYDMTVTVRHFLANRGKEECAAITDFEYVLEKYERTGRYLREQLSYTASMASLKESRFGIQQNKSVKRLTQLAFIFIPLSFVTSVFGMNVDVLSGNGVKWWTVVIGAVVVYFIVAISVIAINRRQITEWLVEIKREKARREWRRIVAMGEKMGLMEP